jgi:hypothetical protein
MHRFLLALLALLLVPGAGSASAAPSRQERTTAVFFRETQNWVAPPFYDFWSGNGGLPIFGYPLAPTDLMTSPDDGKVYATQIFERNRLEYHPENPAPYRVQLGRLGVEVLQKQGRNWQDFPKGEPKRGCDFFQRGGEVLIPGRGSDVLMHSQASVEGFNPGCADVGGVAFVVELDGASDTVHVSFLGADGIVFEAQRIPDFATVQKI